MTHPSSNHQNSQTDRPEQNGRTTVSKFWVAFVAVLVVATVSLATVPKSHAATAEWIFTSTTTVPPTDPDTAGVELGLKFVPKASGTITALRFYKPRASKGPYTARLWNDRGQVVARTNFNTVTSKGWQTATLSPGVQVTAGREYTASYSAHSGRYAATKGYFSKARESAHLHMPSDAGVYTYRTGAFPTNTYQGSNYYVDVQFTPAPSSPAPTMTTSPPTPSSSGYQRLDLPADSTVDPESSAVTLGVRFRADIDGYVAGVEFRRVSPENTAKEVQLWDAKGVKLAASSRGSVGMGLVQQWFDEPIPVSKGAEYVASYFASAGKYNAKTGVHTAERMTGALTTPRGAGVYAYGPAVTFPSSSYRAADYQVTPIFVAERTGTQPVPSSPSPPSEPTGLPTDKFPVMVWLQGPDEGWGQQWKDIGINGFLGLWRWPEDGDKYPGWSTAVMNGLVQDGMYAYGGESPEAIQQTLTMPNNDRIVGWLAGDEPDMFGPDSQEWNRRLDAMLAVEDRPVAANFGLGFGGFDWWYDHISDAERAAWCAKVDVPSVDYYGHTAINPPGQNGAWTYGRAVDNLRKACGDNKPLGVFVETAEIKEGARTPTPADIKSAAWNGVIHGADVLNFFVHDFDCSNNTECGPGAFIKEPKYAANRRAVKEVTDEFQSYYQPLKTPDVRGPDAAQVTGIPLHTLTKKHAGKTYVFAQSAGDPQHEGGYSGTATVRFSGKSFTDTWAPNQVRVYIAE